MGKGKAFLNSAIALYFIICLEILIMISPFAGFFYSAFNRIQRRVGKRKPTAFRVGVGFGVEHREKTFTVVSAANGTTIEIRNALKSPLSVALVSC